MSTQPFDPAKHFIQLRSRKGGGTQDYLPVSARMAWLRSVHPEAVVETECLRDTADSAAFKATITIPGHGAATGHGDETQADFRDFYCKAETKALGRALAVLGFGTLQAGDELDSGDQPVATPARTRAQSPQSSPTSRPAAAPQGGGPPPYNQGEYDAMIDTCWHMAEDGDALDAIKQNINGHWARLTKAQRAHALEQAAGMEQKFYAPAGAAG